MSAPDHHVPPAAAPRLRVAFAHALDGMRALVATQRNARIHMAVAVVVVAAGFALGVSRGEWLALILCIGMVIAAEAMNSALESLADAVHPERHPLVGRAKDCAAAAVLVCALAAAAVGVVVFLPRLWQLVFR